MKTFLLTFLFSLIPMVAIDFFWLSLTKNFYSRNIGHLMDLSFKINPAVLLYVIYTAALSFLVIYPALTGNYNFLKVFACGAFFGIAAYGCYDLTNQATLKNWPSVVTIVDMAWGATLTGAVSLISFSLAKYFS